MESRKRFSSLVVQCSLWPEDEDLFLKIAEKQRTTVADLGRTLIHTALQALKESKNCQMSGKSE